MQTDKGNLIEGRSETVNEGELYSNRLLDWLSRTALACGAIRRAVDVAGTVGIVEIMMLLVFIESLGVTLS